MCARGAVKIAIIDSLRQNTNRAALGGCGGGFMLSTFADVLDPFPSVEVIKCESRAKSEARNNANCKR